jgi:hypothetical protein
MRVAAFALTIAASATLAVSQEEKPPSEPVALKRVDVVS